jgi:hypothetical protein
MYSSQNLDVGVHVQIIIKLRFYLPMLFSIFRKESVPFQIGAARGHKGRGGDSTGASVGSEKRDGTLGEW